MSEIVERVAKAIMGAENPDALDQYTEMARAAIEAMREPTQDMRLAGVAEWCKPDATLEHESTLVFNVIWRAMVDAAL